MKKHIQSSTFLPFMCMSLHKDWQRFKEIQRHFTSSGTAKPFSFKKIKARKKSDTLFVLGSGASINEMQEEHWQQVREHDSVGFNFWLIHPFVPTYYFWEMPLEDQRRDVFIDLLLRKQQAYRDTIFIGRRVWPTMVDKVQEILDLTPFLDHYNALSIDLPPKGNYSKAGFERSIKMLNQFGVIDLLLRKHLLFHRRGSLSDILAFALGMGYKKIVLCGVDLLSKDYFFDQVPYRWKGNVLPVPPRVTGNVHSTVDPSKVDITIDEFLYVMRDLVLKPRQVTLELLSTKSRLYPELDAISA